MVTSGDLSTNTELIFIYILTLFVLKGNNCRGGVAKPREKFCTSSGCEKRHPLCRCFLGVTLTPLKRGQMLALQAAAWGLEAFFAFQLFDVALVLEVPAWRALPAEGRL